MKIAAEHTISFQSQWEIFYHRNELKLRNPREMLIFTAEQSRIKSSQRGLPLGENSCKVSLQMFVSARW